MGLVINKLLGSPTMGELFAQLEIEPSGAINARPVHFGGPVEGSRGFVLHTADYREEATLHVDGNIAMTGEGGKRDRDPSLRACLGSSTTP
jgi:putative transcriptional regulator